MAFLGCSNLRTITILSNIKNIESNAFFDCARLVEVYNINNMKNSDIKYYINSVKVIHKSLEEKSCIITSGDFEFIYDNKYYLFYYIRNDNNIILPSDINVSEKAFNYCDNLKYIYYEDNLNSFKIIKDCQSFISSNDYSIYFYSNIKPIKPGKYYHYVDNIPTIWQ